MSNENIAAIGHLLSSYQSDLTYIVNFQKCKSGQLAISDYVQKSPGSFKSFLNEFRVARNVEKNKTEELLKTTLEWVKSSTPNDVDGLAQHLKNKGLTHEKTAVSLASKILFLNEPYIIIPFDNLAKKAVGMKKDNQSYKEYFEKVNHFKKVEDKNIIENLNSVFQHVSQVEKLFQSQINDIPAIRYNRFLDKILWVTGKN